MKTVLVTPLDWGLGHATRCIPIIRELLATGCRVCIAGTGDSLQVLVNEFPQLLSYNIPGYEPVYPSGNNMAGAMVKQLRKFFRAAKLEHTAIKKIVDDEQIDIVISDNRYGAWSESAFNIIITHQSDVMMPQRFGWASLIVRKIIASRISKFHECWIPDFPDGRLSGGLTHRLRADNRQTVRFLGAISRLHRLQKNQKYDVAAVLSGPEPQRSALEAILLAQLSSSALKYVLVRGLPSLSTDSDKPNVINYLNAAGMEQLMAQSELIICRSGYSSVLDLARCGKKAILIPTPGQTEQEFLAGNLKKAGIAYSMAQKDFDLSLALNQSLVYSGFTAEDSQNNLLQKAIDGLMNGNAMA